MTTDQPRFRCGAIINDGVTFDNLEQPSGTLLH